MTPGCPNAAPARDRIRRAPRDAGLPDVPVRVRVLTEREAAGTPGSGGSPTVLVDGIGPFADQVQDPTGPSCRLYRSATGTDGAPPPDGLRAALRRPGPA